MSSIANNEENYLIVLESIGVIVKEKYDRMSVCGKNDFDMKKVKRRRWKRTNSDTQMVMILIPQLLWN